MTVKARTTATLAAGILLAAYGAFLLRHTSFSVGGSDSSGYLNTATRMANGKLVERPRTLDRLGLPDQLAQIFIPLGFVTGPRSGTMAPFYPFGLPAQMAGAARIFGWEKGPFLVSPISGVLCLILFFLLGCELSLSNVWAAAGALLFAGWPVLIGQAIQPLSDASATLWCLASVLCAVKARRRSTWALAGGACFGIAVMVRPANLLLAIPLSFALPIAVAPLAFFVAGGLPLAAIQASLDIQCYGNALQTGYGRVGIFGAMALANFPPRLIHYGGWILRTLTPLVPAAWLALLADRRVEWRDRALLTSWLGSFFLFYCLFEPYDSYWFVRYLLPAAPALLLGALLATRDLLFQWLGQPAKLAISLLLIGAILFAEIRSLRSVGILQSAEGESVYPQICAWAARTVPAQGVVLSMAASGALEHYTNLSYARWDWLSPEQFEQLRATVESQGGRWFALLFPFEAAELQKHVPGNWRQLGQLRDVGLWELAN